MTPPGTGLLLTPWGAVPLEGSPPEVTLWAGGITHRLNGAERLPRVPQARAGAPDGAAHAGPSPTGYCTAASHNAATPMRGGTREAGPAIRLLGSRAALFPDSPIPGEQTWGGRREEALVTQGSTTPGPVSYLPT